MQHSAQQHDRGQIYQLQSVDVRAGGCVLVYLGVREYIPSHTFILILYYADLIRRFTKPKRLND